MSPTKNQTSERGLPLSFQKTPLPSRLLVFHVDVESDLGETLGGVWGTRGHVGVVSENANGAESSNPGSVVKIRGDQPTRLGSAKRRPRIDRQTGMRGGSC